MTNDKYWHDCGAVPECAQVLRSCCGDKWFVGIRLADSIFSKGNGYAEAHVDVTHCPWCGAKLAKGEGE